MLERVKFLAIVSSNIDEFFQKAHRRSKQQVGAQLHSVTQDGRTPAQQIADGVDLITKLEAKNIEFLDKVITDFNTVGVWLAPYKEPTRNSRRVRATPTEPSTRRRTACATSPGSNPMALKRGIEKAVAAGVDSIGKQSRDVEGKEEIAMVATISAADTQVGDTIAEAFEKVGKDGVITVEESQTFRIELEFVEGMQFDKGYISPYFGTDPDRMETVYDDAYLLLVGKKIPSVQDILPLLEKVAIR